MTSTNRMKPALVLVLGSSLLLNGCETMQENPVISSLLVGGGTYAACKAAGKSDKVCLAAGAATGAITYGYLQYQLNEMKKLENVEASACEASDPSRQAYCVRMDGNAVNFASNSAAIAPESMNTLKNVAGVIKQSPDTLVYIEGHTDADGPETYNQQLSEKRAISVQSAFVREGISEDRMQALGYGESKPVDPANKALNRRVEIRVEGGAS